MPCPNSRVWRSDLETSKAVMDVRSINPAPALREAHVACMNLLSHVGNAQRRLFPPSCKHMDSRCARQRMITTLIF